MNTWRPLNPDQRADWDRLIAQSAQAPVFQTWGWGELKQEEGWAPVRFAARDKGGIPVAFAQVLVRRMPGGTKFVWVPGGPLRNSNAPFWSELLTTFHVDLERVLGRCYVRCSFMTPRDGDSAYALARNMRSPIVKLNSGYSVLLDLRDDEAVWLSLIDAKHRYYVRKAKAAGLTWLYGDNDVVLGDLSDLSSRMGRDKGLLSQGVSRTGLSRMRALLPGIPRVLVGYLDGEAVTACLVLRRGPVAFYATAATVGRGREVSAAYAMLAELRSRLRDEEVEMLDFGGVDPVSEVARGVDHFKRGFGGRVVEYLGEWESGGRIARILGNLSIAIKQR